MKFQRVTSYGRVGEAFVRIAPDQTCDRCGAVAPCLVVDTSEYEYDTIDLCRSCIDDLFVSPDTEAA